MKAKKTIFESLNQLSIIYAVCINSQNDHHLDYYIIIKQATTEIEKEKYKSLGFNASPYVPYKIMLRDMNYNEVQEFRKLHKNFNRVLQKNGAIYELKKYPFKKHYRNGN